MILERIGSFFCFPYTRAKSNIVKPQVEYPNSPSPDSIGTATSRCNVYYGDLYGKVHGGPQGDPHAIDIQHPPLDKKSQAADLEDLRKQQEAANEEVNAALKKIGLVWMPIHQINFS